MRVGKEFATKEGNSNRWGPVYRWCRDGSSFGPRGVLSTLRKKNGEFTSGLVDSAELLLKVLVPPDSNNGESEEHSRIRNETGLFLEDSGVNIRDTGKIGDQILKFSQEEVRYAIWRMGRD